MERGKGQKQVIEHDSDSDDDEFQPPQLKKSNNSIMWYGKLRAS